MKWNVIHTFAIRRCSLYKYLWNKQIRGSSNYEVIFYNTQAPLIFRTTGKFYLLILYRYNSTRIVDGFLYFIYNKNLKNQILQTEFRFKISFLVDFCNLYLHHFYINLILIFFSTTTRVGLIYIIIYTWIFLNDWFKPFFYSMWTNISFW